MTDRQPAECWLTDMDGVLVHEGVPVPGAQEFIQALEKSGKRYLVLTNNSIYTPRDLHARLRVRPGSTCRRTRSGPRRWPPRSSSTRSGRRARRTSIGEAGLTTALHEIGYMLTDSDPDYVVLGETRSYSFTAITRAIRLVDGGARFIATNPDPTGPSAEGALPATGAVAALITRATGVEPYFVGKPNPLMMRSALNNVGGHSETTAMIGDRMDTDIVAGMEAGLETVLVLTGVTTREMIDRFPFRPSRVVDSIADLVDEVG